MHYRYLAVITCLFCLSCSSEDEQAQPVMSELVGLWQGIIKSNGVGDERITDVSLKLNAEQTFTLTKLSDRSTASGRYDDFPQLKALTLRVDDSNINEFALTGGIRDYEYELHDGELLLNSSDGQVRLKKPEHEIKAAAEVWICKQSDSDLVWSLTLSGDSFDLHLEKIASTEASVYMSGSVSSSEIVADSQELMLVVERGEPRVVYNQLSGIVRYKENDAQSLTLQPLSGYDSDVPLFGCTQDE